MCALRTDDPPAVSANPHLTTETLTAGNADAAIAAILLHGRDQDPEWMLDLARRIDLDDAVSYVVPRAAFRRAGAQCELRVYDDEEHGVNDDEAAAVRGLLLSLLEDTRHDD
jgi:hypothetical protein